MDMNSEAGIVPKDGLGKSVPKNKVIKETIDLVKEHIRLFPRYTSHYNLTLNKLYEIYCEWCSDSQHKPEKQWCYRNVFNTILNLSFHRPYTYMCNKCDTFVVHIKHETDTTALAMLKQEQELHHRRTQKELNRTAALLCYFRPAKTLPTPTHTNNKVSYLRVLWTYNLCIHNLLTGRAKMYMWGENYASRGSQEIRPYLKIRIVETLNIDCCGGQNRNKNILKYWTMMVKQTPIEVINHKFLEPGHTLMECDTDFGLIEKHKKFLTNIYVPSDWMDTVKQRSKQFQV
ncbi:hypothetical protein PR048_020205 [Dryococelus australis]|uniref:DUF7869 domain-containing protein n=1 Tax=Dryococelus australis TaxID=614101 RepID=A0ABQ9H5R5_9NEOP|nr:hypothetical protein PR048_020205 [Dryococelus australis]